MRFNVYFENCTNRSYRKLDEQAARQRQREIEAEERRAARKTGAPMEPRAPVRASSPERTAPRIPLVAPTGGGSSWRERQRAKEASGAAETSAESTAPPTESAPPKKTGYVPPHLRSRDDSANRSGDSLPRREIVPPARNGTPPTSSSPAPREGEELKSSSGAWRPSFRSQTKG